MAFLLASNTVRLFSNNSYTLSLTFVNAVSSMRRLIIFRFMFNNLIRTLEFQQRQTNID